jgi:lipoprotein-releasing system permease protein
MYKWFMAWRYLHTKLIAIFAVLGVTLCVAMVLVVMSVMGGFLDTIKERSRGLLSDIVMDNTTLQGWPFYEEFARRLKDNLPEVVKTSTPVIYNYGIFRVPSSSYTKPTQVVGIRFNEYGKVNDFNSGLHYEHYYPGTTHLGIQKQPVAGYAESGRFTLPREFQEANDRWREMETDAEAIADYDKEPFVPEPFAGRRVFAVRPEGPGYLEPGHQGVIVGCDLLNKRRPDGNFERAFARGLTMALTLMPITVKGNLKAEGAVKMPLRYADDSRTGVYEVDSKCVYVDFDVLQHKLAMDPQELVDGGSSAPRTTQLLIALKEGVSLLEGRERITNEWERFLADLPAEPTETELHLLSYVDVQTWEDLQKPFITAVEKEKVLVTILFSLISGIAVVLIGCIFYMIVQKKTRDIGVLKALGATGPGVAGLFIIYAAVVGLVGSILGTTIGATFVYYINDIQDWLISINPQLQVWSPEVYTFDEIPNVVKGADAVWISIVAVLSSVVGSLIPAALAGLVWPVDALRYE